jgi:hypothetical protein
MLSNKPVVQPIVLLLTALSLVPYYTADAQVKCFKAENKVVRGRVVPQLMAVNRPSACRRGEVLAQAGAQGLTGAQGPTGPQGVAGATGSQGSPGADGNPLFYGNSTTPLLVSSGIVDLDDNSGPAVLNFSEMTISAGATVQVSSGSTIRVAGPCTIEGTLSVGLGAGVGAHSQLPLTGSYPSSVPADPGMTARAASPADGFRQSEFPAATTA